jgi:hypothetical protein
MNEEGWSYDQIKLNTFWRSFEVQRLDSPWFSRYAPFVKPIQMNSEI